MMLKHIVVGVAVVAALAVTAFFFIGIGPFGITAPGTIAGTGLITQDIVVGSGPAAAVGDTLRVHYTGSLENGTVFDSSVDRDPYTFVLGAGTVIAGWDEGLVGMREGGKRLIIVPPSLGYGAAGSGPVPPNATLIFEVELISVQSANAQ